MGVPRRIWCTEQNCYRVEHIVVWEHAHGPVPDGHVVVHKNGDRRNSSLDNLELISRLEHQRRKGGHELRDGEWWKACRKCGEWFPVDDYYKRKGGEPNSWCRNCIKKAVGESERRRRQLMKTNPNSPALKTRRRRPKVQEPELRPNGS